MPRPRPSMRAPRGIFCCKPVSALMQRLAIGGGVTIGIVTYEQVSRVSGAAKARCTKRANCLLLTVLLRKTNRSLPAQAVYRLRCPQPTGQAMKKRSRAGGDAAKSRREKAPKPQRHSASKGVSSSTPIKGAEVGSLASELREAREQQQAASEVLQGCGLSRGRGLVIRNFSLPAAAR